MLEQLLATTASDGFEDDGWVEIRAVGSNETGISLNLGVRLPSDSDSAEEWRVQCHDVREVSVRSLGSDDLRLIDSHPVLLQYREPTVDLYFRNAPADPCAVMGALCRAHQKMMGDWVSLATFLNKCMQLESLLAGGFGLLATGPELLLREYGVALTGYGLSPNFVDERPPKWWDGNRWRPEDGQARALILGETFVVAGKFDGQVVR